ncbi:MAG: DUF177 domain-containing protein [Chlorobi bacterium]|nr:DUF177 domain-containing protein [Chlorobiota bacterium]
MKDPRRTYDIKLFDLEEGDNRFRYRLGQDFFDAFGPMEFRDAEMDVDVNVVKRGNLMEVHMQSKGSVELPDDRTGEPYRQPLEGDLNFLIRYGHEFNDDNADLVVIPFQTPVYNMAQPIYEMVLLSIPMKHLDPSVPEPLLPEAEEETKAVDPRFEILKKLINDKNK